MRITIETNVKEFVAFYDLMMTKLAIGKDPAKPKVYPIPTEDGRCPKCKKGTLRKAAIDMPGYMAIQCSEKDCEFVFGSEIES